jgi:sulfonate transport system ATP-binding protein
LETHFVGQVNFDSQRVTRPSRKIQIVFQDNRLFPWLNSHHNIAFATKNSDRRTRAERTKLLLNGIGLSDRAKAFPKDLSGGQESRVALARAFADPPELLLLDEPFRALDAVTKSVLQEKLLKFLERTKTTVVLVSHSIGDAVLMSDRVIVLSHNPLCVHKTFKIDKPRPRTRGDVDLVTISTQMFTALKETIPT